MIIVLKPDCTESQLQHICEKIQEMGFKHEISRGVKRTLVGVIETHLTSGDAEVRELISLSFLDSVDASPANEVLRLHFGPSLRAEAARRDGWTES